MTTPRATRKPTRPKPATPERVTYVDAAGVAREAFVTDVPEFAVHLAAAGARIVHPSE